MRFAWLFVGLVLAVGGGRADAARGGRLCFARSNDLPSMNRVPVRVWGEQSGRSRKLATLKGGQKTCVDVPLGKWSLEARSARPDDPKATNVNECRSFPLAVEVTKTEPITISVAPLGRGTTYLCGWNLE